MNQRERKEIEIVNGALELTSPAERAVYLDRACRGEPALRRKVEALLRVHTDADALFERPTANPGIRLSPTAPVDSSGAAVPQPLAEGPGMVIGRYKLLQLIGEGEFGAVYMAEQKEPAKRRVALKIIKLGMDTRQVVARFEAERQALALMDHPHIAKVLDAGATESGRPYFVMELVHGVSITQYCDENNLPPLERLKLFTQVCHAIQHAHQKGIIHRDIKPSNILVTIHDGVPVPKVIDFGIAKATQQELTEKTLFTQFQQFIGTPAYMSPEQAQMSGLDINTRSDIYALGVLLYELLTGKTPFDAKTLLAAGLDEMRRIIREQEPVRPSTRVSTMGEAERTSVAKHRQAEAPKLIHLLRGDLDWIVMKCLEKDRTRRYETANALAQDIERHMKHEPVAACPPSTAYRAQKFVRRNRVMVTVAALFVCLAALTTAGALAWLAHTRVQWARKQAVPEIERITQQARQVWDYPKFRLALQIGQRALRYAPEDPELKKAVEDCSTLWSIKSDPSGARVSVKPYDDPKAGWQALGPTPLHDFRLGLGFFVIRFEKAGFETVEVVGGSTVDDYELHGSVQYRRRRHLDWQPGRWPSDAGPP
jgi:tRNA A-37 threonylcarbamoyl transferase component Bud32